MKLLRIILFPISLLYGCVVFLRNRAFDMGVLRSERGALPTIVIGNVTVGGTGKTPFALLIMSLLGKRNVGFLSRGYGRQSRGFQLITTKSKVAEVGDEPLLIQLRAHLTAAAVCERRVNGVAEIKRRFPNTDVVVLDDAMQHRHLAPNCLVMLTTYQNPFYNDVFLPTGKLRDNRREAGRAHAIVVTKCPSSLKKEEEDRWISSIRKYSNAPVFFTSILYGRPIAFGEKFTTVPPGASVVVATGIASPQVFVEELQKSYSVKKVKVFPDHHDFSIEDVRLLLHELSSLADEAKALLVTEKDAVKLKAFDVLNDYPVFFVPIDFFFLKNQLEFEEILNAKCSL